MNETKNPREAQAEAEEELRSRKGEFEVIGADGEKVKANSNEATTVEVAGDVLREINHLKNKINMKRYELAKKSGENVPNLRNKAALRFLASFWEYAEDKEKEEALESFCEASL